MMSKLFSILAVGVGLFLSTGTASAQPIYLQVQPQIPVQNFNPMDAVRQGAEASQRMFENERRAREYNARRRIYGDAGAYSPPPPPPVAAAPQPYVPAPIARAPAAPGTILIFGGRGHKEYLGCLTCNEFENSSVWNDTSDYGWHNSVGKWSDVGQYGSTVDQYSACNEFSTDPPIMVRPDGRFVARLSVSDMTQDSVCGISGDESVCRSLRLMCMR